MTSHTGPRALGEFLKARRAQLAPEDCGLPESDSTRKVAGLRREEVARLAAISVDYYTRLEQGRVRASTPMLATLVRALRLDDDQQSYLYELAGRTDDRPRRRRPVQQVRPAMRRLLYPHRDTRPRPRPTPRHPGLEPGRHGPLHRFRRDPGRPAQLPASDVHRPGDPGDAPGVEPRRPGRRRSLRMEAAAGPDDPELDGLVAELSAQDADFRAWWAEHRVNSASYGTKRYRHPLVGDLTLDCDTWTSPDSSGQRLMVLTAETSTLSHDTLRTLTSWTAERVDASRVRDRTP